MRLVEVQWINAINIIIIFKTSLGSSVNILLSVMPLPLVEVQWINAINIIILLKTNTACCKRTQHAVDEYNML